MLESVLKILLINILVFSFLISIINNTIYNIIFLIFILLNSSIILLIIGFEFLGLIYVIVYLGAIIVLFLFIIMMISDNNVVTLDKNFFYNFFNLNNLKKIIFLNFFKNLFEFLIFLFLLIFIFNYIILNDNLFFFDNLIDFKILNNEKILIKLFFSNYLNNLTILANLLYNEFGFLIILSSFILLVVMLGVILINIVINNNIKKQLISIQNKKLLLNSINLYKIKVIPKQQIPKTKLNNFIRTYCTKNVNDKSSVDNDTKNKISFTNFFSFIYKDNSYFYKNYKFGFLLNFFFCFNLFSFFYCIFLLETNQIQIKLSQNFSFEYFMTPFILLFLINFLLLYLDKMVFNIFKFFLLKLKVEINIFFIYFIFYSLFFYFYLMFTLNIFYYDLYAYKFVNGTKYRVTSFGNEGKIYLYKVLTDHDKKLMLEKLEESINLNINKEDYNFIINDSSIKTRSDVLDYLKKDLIFKMNDNNKIFFESLKTKNNYFSFLLFSFTPVIIKNNSLINDNILEVKREFSKNKETYKNEVQNNSEDDFLNLEPDYSPLYNISDETAFLNTISTETLYNLKLEEFFSFYFLEQKFSIILPLIDSLNYIIENYSLKEYAVLGIAIISGSVVVYTAGGYFITISRALFNYLKLNKNSLLKLLLFLICLIIFIFTLYFLVYDSLLTPDEIIKIAIDKAVRAFFRTCSNRFLAILKNLLDFDLLMSWFKNVVFNFFDFVQLNDLFEKFKKLEDLD